MRQCINCLASLDGLHGLRKRCDACQQENYDKRKEKWAERGNNWYKESPEALDRRREQLRQAARKHRNQKGEDG